MTRTILYIGNVGPEAHASYCTEQHVKRDAEALGHTVIPVMESPTCHTEARAILDKHRVDLVLYTRTEGLRWAHDDARALWEQCHARGMPTASLHLDLFHGIARRDVKATRGNALFAVEYVFTADGGHDAEWEAAGVNHHWLPPAVVSDECYVGSPRAEFAGDVAFVGSSRGYHHEWNRRRVLVAELERRFGSRLVRAGDGRTVREGDLNDLYASVKVSAGDSLAPDYEAARYWSDRIPEATGRGSILVHPMIDAAYDQFGDHVVWSGWDAADQCDVIADVLSWSDTRRAAHIAEAVAFVKAHHTYRSRVQTVLDTIGL